MGGFLNDSGNAGTSVAMLGGIQVQTSAYGLTIPVGYGRGLVAMNLGWYDNFKAIPIEDRSSAGKGGSSAVPTGYTYTASVIGLLCEGAIGLIRTVWVGKETFTGNVQGTKLVTSSEMQAILGSPVTLTHAATFDSLVACTLVGNVYDLPDIPLIEGVDFTRSGGVLTFLSGYIGRSARIDYLYTTTVDAMSALGKLGLSLKQGLPGQAVWPYLTSNYPTAAIGYSGIAYVYAQDYAASTTAQIENHNFEVDFQGQLSGTVPDCDPAFVVTDILTNTRYGVGFPTSQLDAFSSFSQYCVASGLLISPVYTTQAPARDALAEIIEACNSDAAWCGDVLKIIPRGDTTITGNGVTYTPNNTPAFSIGPDDILANSGSPVSSDITDPADRKNQVTIEYFDRSQKYRVTPVTYKDEAAIATYGLRAEGTMGWRLFADGSIASQAAQIRGQRYQAAIARHEFSLPWRFLQLELGDLLILNDPPTSLANAVVKVLSLEEGEDDAINVVAEDFPIGHASAPLYAPQITAGWNPNQNVDPGSVAAPVFLEPPGSSVGGSGLEVWVAASGASPYWGGADVYCSLDDGASYKWSSRIEQSCRIGTLQSALAAGVGASLDVLLTGRGGKLFTTSAVDADALATLCFVGDPASGEWLAYQTATLTAANRYTLTGLRRGRYGSSDQAALAGAKFVFNDSSIARSGALPQSMVGRVIKFKFCSYNLWGGALESLATAPEYAYVVTGRFMGQTGKPISANKLVNATFDAGLGPIEFHWANDNSLGDIGGLDDLLAKPALRIDSSPSNIMLGQQGVASPYQFALWPAISVKAGQRYCSFIGLVCHRASGNLTGWWLDSSGAIIGTPPAGNTLTSDLSKNPANPADYRQSGFFSVAPAGAVAFRPIAVKYGTDAGQTASGMYMHEPFFGVALAEQTEYPIWEAGGANTVGENQIAVGATYSLKPYSLDPEIVVPYDADTPLVAAETLGPFDLDTQAIITAEAYWRYAGFQVGAAVNIPGPYQFIAATVAGVVTTSVLDHAPNGTTYGVPQYARLANRLVVTLPAGSTISAQLIGHQTESSNMLQGVRAARRTLSVEITKNR